MVDVVTQEKRSSMMAGIRGKNTKPETLIRKGLHKLGFRYRLHENKLPGKPDLVLPKYNAVILIHGCFWHKHNCHLFKWPSSNSTFWKKKISGNELNDIKIFERLRQKGWRILTIWECAIKGRTRVPMEEIIQSTTKWLKSDEPEAVISGITSNNKNDESL